MRRFLIGALALQLAGCAGLLVRNDDASAQKAGKIGARVLLGVSTLGISEFHMAERRREQEAREQQEAAETQRQEFRNRVWAATTKAELVALLGMPTKCEPLGGDKEACAWQLQREAFVTLGPLAPIPGARIEPLPVAVTRRIPGTVMTCILPIDGGKREPDSCVARSD